MHPIPCLVCLLAMDLLMTDFYSRYIHPPVYCIACYYNFGHQQSYKRLLEAIEHVLCLIQVFVFHRELLAINSEPRLSS